MDILSRMLSFPAIWSKASDHASPSLGSRYRAAEPQVSGIAAVLEATTGHPQYIASIGGSPKPSKMEGNSSAFAF